jgi:hypothetical protein
MGSELTIRLVTHVYGRARSASVCRVGSFAHVAALQQLALFHFRVFRPWFRHGGGVGNRLTQNKLCVENPEECEVRERKKTANAATLA